MVNKLATDWDGRDVRLETITLEKIQELLKGKGFPDGGKLRIEISDYRRNISYEVVDTQSNLEKAIGESWARLSAAMSGDTIEMEWWVASGDESV